MRVPSWVIAAGAASALATATWMARPAPPAGAPVVLAVPAVSASPGGGVDPDWAGVVHALDVARSLGYADPLTADPTRWLDPSCPCLAIERGRLDRLVRAGRRMSAQARPDVRSVRLVSEHADRVTVEVTDVMPAYDVEEDGDQVAHYRARGPLTWRGVLLRSRAGWRWSSLTRDERGDGIVAPEGESDPGVDRAAPG